MMNECDAAVRSAPSGDEEAAADSLMSRTSPAFVLVSAFEPKTRRFSASFSPLRSASASPAPTDSISDERISIRQMTRPQTPSSPCIPSHRVNQLKHEETCDVAGREVASEKEFQSTMQISQSCEDLFLSDSAECRGSSSTSDGCRPTVQACTEPIHVTMPTGLSALVSSPYPSPTRVSHRQCFSPSMQIPVRNASFSPTPSPSPTRKSFYTSRRSLSPIAMRASPLGPVKRRCDLEDRADPAWIPNKKYHFAPASSPCGLPPLSPSVGPSSDSGDCPPAPVPVNGRSAATLTPDSTYGSESPSAPSPLQVRSSESPAHSPLARSAGDGSSSNGSSSNGSSGGGGVIAYRSRERCAVPSPLAAESADCELKVVPSIKDRKDFSRLFMPITKPVAGVVGVSDSDDGPAADTADDGMVVDDCVPTASAVEQDHSISVDPSHPQMDP